MVCTSSNPPTKRKLIRVTEQCIRDGMIGSSDSCPISLAFLDAGCPNTHVFYGKYNLVGDSQYTRRKIADTAHQFVKDFDSERPVEPFNFFAEVPI